MKYNVYYGHNLGRATNLSRAEAIAHYHDIKPVADREEEDVHIYCPTKDTYVDNYFLPYFLDQTSNFGKLMFEDGANLLSNEGNGYYKWRRGNEIVVSSSTEIKVISTLPQATV